MGSEQRDQEERVQEKEEKEPKYRVGMGRWGTEDLIEFLEIIHYRKCPMELCIGVWFSSLEVMEVLSGMRRNPPKMVKIVVRFVLLVGALHQIRLVDLQMEETKEMVGQ